MNTITLLNFTFIFLFLLSTILSKVESSSISSIGVIPFKIYHSLSENNALEFTTLDYYNIYHQSKLYLELNAGQKIKRKYLSSNKNKGQILSSFISIDDYLFSIDDNYDTTYHFKCKDICKYSTELSENFEVISYENVVSTKTSIYSSDSFKIYTDLSLNKSEEIKMEFLYYKNDTENISYACGKIGVLFVRDKTSDTRRRNFLNQIHNGINTNDYSFTFKYDNENDNGLFIIGIESYEKNINQNTELINLYNKEDKFGSRQKWAFNIDNVYINNKYYQFEGVEISIKTDYEGFEFPSFMFDLLNEIYFNKYYNNSICVNEKINSIYPHIIIYCDANKFTKNDINNFPEISLFKFKLGFNITFSGEDLFHKIGNKYFFKILFSSILNTCELRMGRFFLKKYPIIFNPESKSMVFYKKAKIEEEYKNITNDKSIFSSLLFKFIIISILFLIVGVFLGRKFCLMRKRKYAQELIENNGELELETKINTKENKLIDI